MLAHLKLSCLGVVAIAGLAAVTGCRGDSATTDGGSPTGDGTRPADADPGDGALVSSTGVTVIVEPNGNAASELVTAINAATTSIYMTMYQIDDKTILNALAAKAAHLDVEVILDSSTATGVDNKSGNMPAYTQLTGAGAKVVWSSPSFTYTHEKTVIIDGTTAWIMTMNLNTSSPNVNREYLAVDTDAADVAEATAIFKADHATPTQTIAPSGDLVVADTNARGKLVQLINTATTTLDVEVEEFSDLDQNGVVDAVVAAAKRGVTTRVVIANATLTTDETNANKTVKNVGGMVAMTGPASGEGTSTNPYIHAKAILVDCVGTTCTRGFMGSENFSAGSLGYNRELGLILNDPTQLAKIKTAINTDFAKGTLQ